MNASTRISRRRVLHLGATCGAAALVAPMAPMAFAQSSGTVRLLVGFPPGGGTDAIARLLAERLKDELGQPVVVENRSGAGGQIAAQALKAAAPDGTTLFLSHDHTVSILPLVVKQPGFDPARDFVAASGFATFANALAVSSATPVQTLAGYYAWVKGNGGGKGNVGVPAPASVPEFLVKVLAQKAGLDLAPVPYRGSAPLINDMLGNQIAAGIGSVPDFIENHRAGRLRVLAVMGSTRQTVLPDVPTLAESGVAGFDVLPYYGVFAPAGTPRAALERFDSAMARVLAQAPVRERLSTLGLTVAHMAPAELAERERSYSAVWARIIKDSGFQPQ